MNKNNVFQVVIFLIIVLSPNLSCTSSQTAEIKANPLGSIPIIAEQPPKDLKLKLKFTSGIRSIFEDSKGNFWFGSHQEGVCFYDGETFTYFTIEDGLSDNQIRTIQEDENGNIWFGTGYGVSSYDGERFINHTTKNIDSIGKISQNENNSI